MIAPAKTKITTPYGQVKNYPLNNGFHTGVDFSYSPDNQIYMPEDGKVYTYSWNGKVYNGNYIIVIAGNHRHFLGHIRNNGFLVKSGQTVKQGEAIAIMGDTGYAIGVHVHWGLRINGTVVDGMKYITKEKDMSKDKLTRHEVIELHQAYFGGNPGKNYDYSDVGKTLQYLIHKWRNNPQALKNKKPPVTASIAAFKDKVINLIKGA